VEKAAAALRKTERNDGEVWCRREMGDIEAAGAMAVRDCRVSGEKKWRRIVPTMMGNAIGLLQQPDLV
jgi:hypothetical protein